MTDAAVYDFSTRARAAGLADDGLCRHGGDALAERALADSLDGPVVCPLVDVAVLRATGADAATFLNNLLTNDITHLPAGTVRLAGLCTPKGRLSALFHVLRDPAANDDFLLLLPAEIAAPVLKKLSMYVLRSKVKLADVTADYLPLGIAARDASALGAVSPRLCFESTPIIALNRSTPPALGISLLPANAAVPDDLVRVGLAAWRGLEIAAGLPRVVAATQEAFVPQMLNLELLAMNGVNFRKGCYPGQEIVARTQYLGKVKRRTYRAALAAMVAPGDAVFGPETGDQPCGAIVSVAPSATGCDVLVCAQSAAVEAGDARVGAPDGPVLQIGTLPYALDGPDTRAEA